MGAVYLGSGETIWGNFVRSESWRLILLSFVSILQFQLLSGVFQEVYFSKIFLIILIPGWFSVLKGKLYCSIHISILHAYTRFVKVNWQKCVLDTQTIDYFIQENQENQEKQKIRTRKNQENAQLWPGKPGKKVPKWLWTLILSAMMEIV